MLLFLLPCAASRHVQVLHDGLTSASVPIRYYYAASVVFAFSFLFGALCPACLAFHVVFSKPAGLLARRQKIADSSCKVSVFDQHPGVLASLLTPVLDFQDLGLSENEL